MKTRMRILLLAISWVWCQAADTADNVLLIIADDFGTDSSSLYNTNASATFPPTPNIASLVQTGVLFENAYACPVCSPTRACIITGQHAFRHGIGNVIEGPTDPRLTAAHFTLPEAFAAQPSLGYALAQFGKWHLSLGPNGPAMVGGWPHFSGSLTGGLPSYTDWTKTVNGSQTSNYTVYATTDNVNDAVAWIQARGTQPWLVWLAFNAPHTPFHVPPTSLHSYGSTPGSNRRQYEAMVEAMDTEIGRLLAAVDRNHTNIIFIGDNGTPAQVIQPPSINSKSKGTVYEGGVHVPMIISGPAVVNPNRHNAERVHVVDLFATILELAGSSVAAAVPAGSAIDSRSLLPVLRNEAFSSPYAYCEIFGSDLTSTQVSRMARDDQFKLIQRQDGAEELYDLGTDLAEATNLLAGSLTTQQQQHYSALTMYLAQVRDDVAEPELLSSTLSGGEFVLTVELNASASYQLWRGSELTESSWARVTNAVITPGATTVELRDPTPPAGPVFYRVIAKTP